MSVLSALAACPRAALAAAAALLLAAATPSARAGSASYAGTFVNDDDRFTLDLTLGVADTLVAQTASYGGGIDSNGRPVAAGGFAPVLSLFGADGLLLQSVAGSASVCGSGVGAADPVSGFCWDAGFSAPLSAGKFKLVLTQDGNTPNGAYLADGFAMSGSPDYTGQSFLGQPGYRFINVDGTQRDGNWALVLTAAIVPEPGAAALLAAGLLALGALTRRQRAAR